MPPINLSTARLLSFSAHPDDEIGGAGGLLIKTVRAGGAVQLTLCLDPAEPRFDRSAEEERAGRLAEFEAAGQMLGAATSYLGLPRYPTVTLPTILPLVAEIRRFKPTAIVTTSADDLHFDHRAVAAIAREAAWHAGRAAFPDCGQPCRVETIIEYEADAPLREPTHLLDISDCIEEKRRILGAYGSQLARKDLVSAGDGLSRFRGLMYRSGDYAEALRVTTFYYG